jgi:gamma-glutamylputrescine oxidase
VTTWIQRSTDNKTVRTERSRQVFGVASKRPQFEAPTYWFEDTTCQFFQPLEHVPAQVDVVIVGGGLLGVSSGYWLAKLGMDALLLESSHLCSGATGRNSGLMLPASTELEDPDLLEHVLHEERIEADYEKPGHMALASTPEIWEAFRSEARRRAKGGQELFALERGECEDILKVRLSKLFLGGRWFRGGRVIHPVKLVYGIAERARKYGLRISAQTRVMNVRSEGRALIVATPRGNVVAKFVIYACSAHVVDFVPELRGAIRLLTANVLSTDPLPPIFQMGMAVDWGTVYWRQARDGTVVIGGDGRLFLNRERAGSPTIRGPEDGLDAFLLAAFPDLGRVLARRRWTGIMDNPVDGKPLVGPIVGRQNQWIVTGFNGHGMPLGLSVGRSVAQSIATGTYAPALAHFNPLRLESTAPILSSAKPRNLAAI